jgi:hypothetical protein
MHNYARNYRNWAPQRRPHTRYQQHPYFPIKDIQEDDGHHADSNYHEGEDSSNESRPFENEIRAIDYYAQRNRNYDRYDISKSSTWNQGSQHDDVSRNSYQADNPAAWSHKQGYSTLPDEFVNTHSSSENHDFRSTAREKFRVFNNQNPGDSQEFQLFNNQNPRDGQKFRVFNNQNPRDNQEFRVFNNQNPRDSQEFIFKHQNFDDGQEFRLKNQNPVDSEEFRFQNQNFGNGQEFRFKNQNTADRQEFRLKNQNFGGGQEFRFKNHNSGNGQESRLNVQNYPAAQETQFNSHKFGSGPTSAVRQESRYNNQNFGGRHELQYTTHIQNSGQESRLKDQNLRGVQNLRYNTQNSAGRYNNQNSGSGAHDSDPSFYLSNGNLNTNRPHRGTEQSQDEAGNSHPNPNSDDLYYKAFRSFSFRRNPTQSGSKAGQFDSVSGGGVIPQSSSPSHQSGVAHSDRQNKWFNDGAGPNKDHDIGFFEGLEDINDKAGV